MKKVFLVGLVMGFSIALALPCKALDKGRLEELVSHTLEKGQDSPEKAFYKFISKTENVDSSTERKLYFTVYYIFDGRELSVQTIVCNEEIWTKAEKNGKSIILIKQKFSEDGTPEGPLDGTPDIYTMSELVKNPPDYLGEMISSKTAPGNDESCRQWYDKFIEKMREEIKKPPKMKGTDL